LNFNAAKIKHLLSQLDEIIGADRTEEKDKQSKEMLRLSKPRLWNVHMKNNAELEMEVDFEEFMLQVGEHTKQDLDKITVFRFHSLLDYIKNKNSDG
jgi:hypothetical protein